MRDHQLIPYTPQPPQVVEKDDLPREVEPPSNPLVATPVSNPLIPTPIAFSLPQPAKPTKSLFEIKLKPELTEIIKENGGSDAQTESAAPANETPSLLPGQMVDVVIKPKEKATRKREVVKRVRVPSLAEVGVAVSV